MIIAQPCNTLNAKETKPTPYTRTLLPPPPPTMGVPGLWSELAPAAVDVALPMLTYDALERNHNHLRGLRIGIDASLWLFHSQQSTGGSNPHLRTLFYRLARLLSLPVLPLFVFDGPKRPAWKRGKKVIARQSPVERNLITLIRAFGFQYTIAPGEAEAELAWLNRHGCIDAVMTDDVDVFVFGANTVIRNWGKKLSGTIARNKRAELQRNLSSSSLSSSALSSPPSASSDVEPRSATQKPGQSSKATGRRPAGAPQQGTEEALKVTGSLKDHVVAVYEAWDIQNMPELCVSRDGLVLVALLAGGDYDSQGFFRCGVKIALALAQAGFGDELVAAFKRSYSSLDVAASCSEFDAFLVQWCDRVRDELRTDSRGFLGRRHAKLASSLSGFANTSTLRQILAYYVWPLTSGSRRSGATSSRDGTLRMADEADYEPPVFRWTAPDLESLVRCAQRFFEWSPETVLARFRSTIWSGLVFRQLRQEVLELNGMGECGPWGELVESPASKAVRQRMRSAPAAVSDPEPRAASIAPTNGELPKSPKKKKNGRPLHESPQATRITDFFAKTSLSSPTKASHRAAASPPPPSWADTEAGRGDLDIVSISRRRKDVAFGEHVEVRALVDVAPMVALAEQWLDDSIGQHETDLGGALEAEGDGNDDNADEGGGKKADDRPAASRKQPADPREPMLLWIVESLLDQGRSGKAALDAFRSKKATAAAAAAAKHSKKTAAVTARKGKKGGEAAATASHGGQRTIESFCKKGGKPRYDATWVGEPHGGKTVGLLQQLDELQKAQLPPSPPPVVQRSRRPKAPAASAPCAGGRKSKTEAAKTATLDEGRAATLANTSTDSIEFIGMTICQSQSRGRSIVSEEASDDWSDTDVIPPLLFSGAMRPQGGRTTSASHPLSLTSSETVSRPSGRAAAADGGKVKTSPGKSQSIDRSLSRGEGRMKDKREWKMSSQRALREWSESDEDEDVGKAPGLLSGRTTGVRMRARVSIVTISDDSDA
ncbi:hypothetical protein ACQY0O_001891 [Thecaphora frezii]